MTQFTDLGLGAPILKALAAENYTNPTPIQAQAIPHVLAGRDLLGIAQTGTGKTAAFGLPMLQRLADNPGRPFPKTTRSLILTPTRELAQQIADSFRVYGAHLRLRSTVVVGGVPIRAQIRALSGGVDILVATPGRLIDLIEQNAVKLDQVEVLVLDEADQMLDLGFIHALRRLVKLVPAKRQTLFFSATMPKSIAELAAAFLNDPVKVAVTPVATTVEVIDQRVVFLDKAEKTARLNALLKGDDVERAIVFTRTKHGADKVVRDLERAGIGAAAIHGNKSQGQRQRALGGFKDGTLHVLVATDIAARGIDVDGISHVVNFDLPNVPETYVHRIGRTARAGAKGIAISLCIPDEHAFLRDIERLTKRPLDLMAGEDAANDPRGLASFGRGGGKIDEGRGGRGRGGNGGGGRNGQQRNGQPRNGQSRNGASRDGDRNGRHGEAALAGFTKRTDAGRPGHRKGLGSNANASRPRDGNRGGPVRFGAE